MNLLTAVCFLVLLTYVTSAPASKPENIHEKTKNYLLKYGYLLPELKDDPEAFIYALKRFQRSGGVIESDEISADTENLMDLPRCDFGSPGLAQYSTVGRWRRKHLRWALGSSSPDMSYEDQKEEIRRAFKVWSDVSELTFEEVSAGQGEDIYIKFATGYHGDGDPFDGRGGTLAHAYFPFAGGDCHLDDSEYFTFNQSSGINLFQVVAHELGHSLGLDHSDDQSALMAAYYRGFQRNFKLGNDDIQGIQALYGRNTISPQQPNNPQRPNTVTPSPRTTRRFFNRPRPTQVPNTPRPTFRPRPTNTPRPTQVPNNPNDASYCQDSSLDTVFTFSNGRTYGFKGDKYYRFNDYGLDQGYPRDINPIWRGLPTNVDAALHLDQGPSGQEETWFFKDSTVYYRLNNGQVARREQPISTAIRGLPNNINAIFRWSGNQKVYAMKGAQYYKLNDALTAVEPQYPRSMSVWTRQSSRNIASTMSTGIDAAVQYKNGRTYFFKGQSYFKIIDSPLQIDNDYPRDISYWWFGC